MKLTVVPALALLMIPASCSEGGGVSEQRPSAEVVEFVAGTIELTGRLAETPDGALQLLATSPQLATPLVQKCSLAGLVKTPEGTLRVPFSLGSHSGMMASRAIPRDKMPSELSMKVSYSPTGYVDGIEHEHDFTATARVGDLALRLRMDPGEAPRSRPTSRPASRPVVIED